MATTLRKCQNCGEIVEVDFLDVLLNLSEPFKCKKCNKEKEKDD